VYITDRFKDDLRMLEGIICPVCENPMNEENLKETLVCPKCKTDLKDRKYLDFLEYLMANGIVADLDFFDASVYSEDIERLEPEDEEEIDPAEFEKKKEIYSLYENEMVPQQNDKEEGIAYEEFEGIEEDWEEFNQREFDGF